MHPYAGLVYKIWEMEPGLNRYKAKSLPAEPPLPTNVLYLGDLFEDSFKWLDTNFQNRVAD